MGKTNAVSAFITYQEAAKITGRTVRTIRRKIQGGEISESQTRKEGGQIKIAVAELQRVFGDLKHVQQDLSGDTGGHDRTFGGVMSGDMSGHENTLREFLNFSKEQLEWEKQRNERMEKAMEEMRQELKITQERLARLLPGGDIGGDTPDISQGTQEDIEVTPERTRRWWRFWKRS